MSKKIPIVVNVEKEQYDWLKEKTRQGYKASSLIRMLIHECMSRQETRASPAKLKGLDSDGFGAGIPRPDSERLPKIDFDGTEVEKATAELARDESLDAKMLEKFRLIDRAFNDPDSLGGMAGFQLGLFKAKVLWELASRGAGRASPTRRMQ